MINIDATHSSFVQDSMLFTTNCNNNNKKTSKAKMSNWMNLWNGIHGSHYNFVQDQWRRNCNPNPFKQKLWNLTSLILKYEVMKKYLKLCN
jgi:hypothetical protein